DRHFGVGADQILLVEPPLHPEADFRYRIFNADGSEVEHCGNGARCFVRFVHEQGLSRRNPLKAEICTGLIVLQEETNGDVTVDIGETRVGPRGVGCNTAELGFHTVRGDTDWILPLPDTDPVALSVVAISNRHAVVLVDNIRTAPVPYLGA